MNSQSYDANGSPVPDVITNTTDPASESARLRTLADIEREPEYVAPTRYGDILVDVSDALIKALDDALIGGMLLPTSKHELLCIKVQALRAKRLAMEDAK